MRRVEERGDGRRREEETRQPQASYKETEGREDEGGEEDVMKREKLVSSFVGRAAAGPDKHASSNKK